MLGIYVSLISEHYDVCLLCFQTDGDSSADDEEVFNDPDDTWEKEIPSPSNSPVA